MSFTNFFSNLKDLFLDKSYDKSGEIDHESFAHLSDYFPIRFYDEETELFMNKDSIGFAIEIIPFLGADEFMFNSFTSFFENILPENASCQIICDASPYIGNYIKNWAGKRKNSTPVFQNITNSRTDFLLNKNWTNLSKTEKFILRNFRVYAFISINEEYSQEVIKQLKEVRTNFTGMLISLGSRGIHMNDTDVLTFMRNSLNATRATTSTIQEADNLEILSRQALDWNSTFTTTPDYIRIETGKTATEVRCLAVEDYPKEYALWEAGSLIGDSLNNQFKLSCPFMLVFCVRKPAQEKIKNDMLTKGMMIQKQAKTPTAVLQPEIIPLAAEYKFLRERLESGGVILESYYSVILFCKPGDGDKVEKEATAMFSRQKWQLAKQKFAQIPTFLSCVPFSFGNGLWL